MYKRSCRENDNKSKEKTGEKRGIFSRLCVVMRFSLSVLGSSALDELDDLNDRNNHDCKQHGNTVFIPTNGGETEEICDEGNFKNCSGEQQGANHGNPQYSVMASQREY